MKLKNLVLSIVTLLFSVVIVNAQVTTSALSGVVKGSDGKGAANVRVKALHLPTGTEYLVVSRKGGLYNIPNMNPGGPYTITFSGGGATDIVKTDVYLALGETENLDAAYAETDIKVVGVRPSRTLKTGTTSAFNNRIISSVPNISRSITNIATLTPQAGGGNSFGGRDGRFNNTQIDGANFNNNFGLRSDPLPGGSSQPISLDAIEEISVNVSPFDVRQANFTGAGLNATTRKGTNTFSGSIFGFYRDQGFIGREAVGVKVPNIVKSSTKTVGFRFGGPIIKNKLFFFINGEGEERNNPGIFWRPSTDGLSNPALNISRTHNDSLQKFSDHLKNVYGYQTGKFKDFDNFEVKNYKFLGRIDWNINKQHSVSLRYNKYNNVDDQQLNNTSTPFAALPNSRFSQNAMSFQNSNYGFENNLQLFAAEVKSNFNSSISNQFIATYTKANDGRTSDSKLFPFIEIMNGNSTTPSVLSSDNYMSAGYEPFTYKNNVENNTININNNFTYSAGKHTLTAGIGYEKIYVANSFFRYGTTYYRFNSLNDFMIGSAPTGFGYTFPNNPAQEVVELDFAQGSLYAQDEIKVNTNFKLNVGLRLDKPFFQNSLVSNPAVDAINLKDLNGNPLNFKTGSWPKERIYYSPRVGFNWDIEGNKKKVLRGGAGLFTGRFPFVWFTNQPSNSFTLVKQFTATGTSSAPLSAYTFNANPFHYDAAVRALPISTAITNLAYVDNNFKMPQVFRLSAGYDQKLDNNWTLTFDAIFNKDVNNLLYYNANQAAPIGNMFGADNRPVWGSTTALRRLNVGLSDAMVLTNTKKGFGLVFTTQIAKRFSDNWDFSIAYTHTIGMDISGNPGATANSAWNNIPSAVGNNNLQLAFNDFATRHRVIAYGSYKLNLSKYAPTTISLVYTGYTQGSFSYTMGGDVNTDGISATDLMYVPNNASEITFAPASGTYPFTPTQQADAFFAYINQDKYLSKRRGRYAERNGAALPFFSNLDLRILQDILPFKGNKGRGIQLSVELENFGNLLNTDWGVQKRVNLNSSRLIDVVTPGTLTTAPVYRVNLVNGQLPTKTFGSVITAGNTWRMNLGVRLNF
jgi:hypothetical protein